MIDDSLDSQAKDRLHESLSVFMDGEASASDEMSVLEKMESDVQLGKTAMRYRQIGDCIRRENSGFEDVDLSAKISAAIDNEPSFTGISLDEAAPVPFYMKTGFIGAVGKIIMPVVVVFAVIIGVRNYTMLPYEEFVADNSMQPSITASGQAIQNKPNAYAGTDILAGYNTNLNRHSFQEYGSYSDESVDQGVRDRFRAYALQHAELSVVSVGQGMLPFARLTSFDVQ